MAISPVSTTRIGDLFVRQRLTSQVQQDQLALFRLQNQISTGKRLQLPSEDAPSALRAINLQRLIDRKVQIKTNLQASTQYLGGADSRLASIASSLNELRGEVVGVSGNTVPESARLAVMQDIDSLLQELVNAGNAKMQGRYLFAGSRSQSQPYDYDGKFVEFSGNDGALRSYVDVERLFETNVAGTDVFGGVSAQVEGSVDLNPHLTDDTLVSSLNGGNGIGTNPVIRLAVDDGTSTTSVVVDLSRAITISDVARFIENAAPTGAELRVDVTGTGLRLVSGSGHEISISEVAEGRTARLLGIYSDPQLAPTDTITGLDLNAAVLKTTRLSDLLGKKSQGVIELAGGNNDIRITAAANGDEFDNVTVEFVSGATAGSESASYNAGTRTLTIQVDDGETTANQIAAAINAEGTFTAQIDYHDATTFVQAGTGTIELGGVSPVSFGPLTTGGVDGVLDTASGFILNNRAQSVTLDISSAETVEDLLNLINGSELGLVAEINASATGINVRSKLSGSDFTIGENGGTTATQLGIRSYTGAIELGALNRGVGVPTSELGADLRIVARDLTEFTVDLGGATTVDDVISRINAAAAAANGGLGVSITASLATSGNGIRIVDTSAAAGTTTIANVEGSRAAEFLGFTPLGQTQADTTTGTLVSEDRHTLETDSVFNTLIRLRDALGTNNTVEIGRSLERLDVDLDRVNFARAEIGSRLQTLEVIETRLEDENVELQSALSQEIDVDLVEAISQLTARQYAFEASLRSSASIMHLSLLNFL
jgi:flagellar hook-associated protein 3 FlgL